MNFHLLFHRKGEVFKIPYRKTYECMIKKYIYVRILYYIICFVNISMVHACSNIVFFKFESLQIVKR